MAIGAESTNKGTSVSERSPLVPVQVQARKGLAREPGDPSLKEPNLGLRNPTAAIPPTAVRSAVLKNRTSFIGAEGPTQYGSTLYMLGLCCTGLITGAGGLNPMGTLQSTAGATVATGVIAARRD